MAKKIILKGHDLKKVIKRPVRSFGTIPPLLWQLNSTKIEVPSFVITYPFYGRIKTARNKQFYPVLYGNNNEVVFTGETHKNKNDVVSLLKMWFPQIEIKR